MTEQRRKILFQHHLVHLFGNTATDNGGCRQCKGFQSGASLSVGCVFRDNRVKTEELPQCPIPSTRKGGGAIFVEEGAIIRMENAVATENRDRKWRWWISPCSLFGPIPLRNASISHAFSGAEGGGGAWRFTPPKLDSGES